MQCIQAPSAADDSLSPAVHHELSTFFFTFASSHTIYIVFNLFTVSILRCWPRNLDKYFISLFSLFLSFFLFIKIYTYIFSSCCCHVTYSLVSFGFVMKTFSELCASCVIYVSYLNESKNTPTESVTVLGLYAMCKNRFVHYSNYVNFNYMENTLRWTHSHTARRKGRNTRWKKAHN